MRYICTSIVATLALAGTSYADTINVPDDYATIQEAVNASTDGDVILVAPGTYYENISRFSAPDISIVSSSGNSEDTIIDGQGGRGIYLTWQSSTSDRYLAINGFTFQNCNAIPVGDGHRVGGAIWHDGANGHVDISNCMFRQNTTTALGWDGAVICTGAGSMLVKDCTFDQNSSACVLFRADSQEVLDCQFTGNTGKAVTLSPVFNTSNKPGIVTNCTFSNNDVGQSVIYSPNSVTGCVLDNNSFERGAVTLDGNASVSQTIFQNNVAVSDGGGIYCQASNGGDASISGCTFINNTSNQNGGAIAVSNADGLHVHNCVFNSNTAALLGGAIYANATVLASNNTGCGNSLPSYYGSIELVNDDVQDQCIDFGNCCIGGSCIPTDESTCVSAGGSFTIEDCSACPGPEPELGACCISGICVPTTLDGCYSASGTYAGDGVDCSEANCPTYCQSDTNQDGTVDIIDLLTVIAAWGPCP